MPYDKWKHHRHSLRLPDYDYTSTGAYFVTICVRGGECRLGEVADGEMQPNECGQIAWDCWQAIPDHFDHVEPDAFTIMPNHVHGIVAIAPTVVGAQHAAPLLGKVQA